MHISKGWIPGVYHLAIGLFYNIQPRKQTAHLKQNPKPANLCEFTVTVGLILYRNVKKVDNRQINSKYTKTKINSNDVSCAIGKIKLCSHFFFAFTPCMESKCLFSGNKIIYRLKFPLISGFCGRWRLQPALGTWLQLGMLLCARGYNWECWVVVDMHMTCIQSNHWQS